MAPPGLLSSSSSDLRCNLDDGIGLAPQSHCECEVQAPGSDEMGFGPSVLSQSLSMFSLAPTRQRPPNGALPFFFGAMDAHPPGAA